MSGPLRRFRLAYFGWSVEFSSPEVDEAKVRREANGLVVKVHGADPSPLPSYVEPGLPFPEHVPVEVWEGPAKGFQPYL